MWTPCFLALNMQTTVANVCSPRHPRPRPRWSFHVHPTDRSRRSTSAHCSRRMNLDKCGQKNRIKTFNWTENSNAFRCATKTNATNWKIEINSWTSSSDKCTKRTNAWRSNWNTRNNRIKSFRWMTDATSLPQSWTWSFRWLLRNALRTWRTTRNERCKRWDSLMRMTNRKWSDNTPGCTKTSSKKPTK